ncbi:MAG: hypothetical protein WCP85_23880 [Mariniphaga sp.]
MELGTISSYYKFYPIRDIVQSNNIDETVKTAFLESAYEKSSDEFKRIMFFEGIIKLSPENQSEILSCYLEELNPKSSSSKYSQIKSIAKSDKIDDLIKLDFMRSVYKIAYAHLLQTASLAIKTN